MDESFLKVKEVHDAMDTLKYISADDQIRATSDLRQKNINDYNSELTVAEERGATAKARETAIKMLSRDMPVEDIADITGFSMEDIRNIQAKKE